MIPLRWLIQEVVATQTGVLFDLAQLSLIGLSPQNLPFFRDDKDPPILNLPLPPVVIPPPIPKNEFKDAVEQLTDQLERKKIWWLLEWIPMRTKFLNEDGVFETPKGWP